VTSAFGGQRSIQLSYECGALGRGYLAERARRRNAGLGLIRTLVSSWSASPFDRLRVRLTEGSGEN
jgi:hypothetical protein